MNPRINTKTDTHYIPHVRFLLFLNEEFCVIHPMPLLSVVEIRILEKTSRYNVDMCDKYEASAHIPSAVSAGKLGIFTATGSSSPLFVG